MIGRGGQPNNCKSDRVRRLSSNQAFSCRETKRCPCSGFARSDKPVPGMNAECYSGAKDELRSGLRKYQGPLRCVVLELVLILTCIIKKPVLWVGTCARALGAFKSRAPPSGGVKIAKRKGRFGWRGHPAGHVCFGHSVGQLKEGSFFL